MTFYLTLKLFFEADQCILSVFFCFELNIVQDICLPKTVRDLSDCICCTVVMPDLKYCFLLWAVI